MSSFQQALSLIREKANSDTEMGLAFEKLSKVFLERDDTQKQQYSQVWHFADWAKERKEYSKTDIGIDLVAKLKEEEGYCAIQCKFYKPDHSISKADLDSFISASSTNDFKRLVLIDTSSQPIGKNAQIVFDNLSQDYIRIQSSEIEKSRIDWYSYINDGSVNFSSKKELKDHQIKALEAVREGLKKDDRGKMIMACGTGKTFTSLRIAEELAGANKMVLYMVPSLALMSQTVREWKNDAHEDFLAFSVCSDQKVGKIKTSDDQIRISLNDLAFPATTDASKLSEKIKRADKSKMKVIFSTYQSIEVISKSQYEFELDEFDLIICDEAHRTTGATLSGEDESNFVKIHSNENIKGKKRLYMTATPKIYGETAKRREDEGEVNLASMDDEKKFGKNLFYRSFGWAVENNLLTDYKVVVLMMDEQIVSDRIQNSFSEGSELELDDATKMIGCYKALAKIGIQKNSVGINEDKIPMKKALAFCQNIRTSKIFSSEFVEVIDEYTSNEKIFANNNTNLEVELFHVDGTFNADQRNEKLNWLKDETEPNICRVLSNARCLSEGVDVPSLDAIMFLHPRRSQIDVVQSVGRVMRKAKGKNLGYVIIPITVAPGVTPEKALNDNERYQVVWEILNALRAHDERFDSTINRIGLGEDVSDRIEIIDGTSTVELEATTTVVEDVRPRSTRGENNNDENNSNLGGENNDENRNPDTEQLSFTLTDISQALKAKIVEKCGTRDYWDKWANDIAKIAEKHIVRINSLVLNSGTPERESFVKFLEEIRDDLNPEISENDAVEMLAQHIITRPVFDTLFQGNRFTAENAVSKAMEAVLTDIYRKQIDTETRTLARFYESVKRRAADINTASGRQQLIVELYERFFQNAFPLMTKKLGIVYTPVEIVDFIIQSIEDLMQSEFNSSLNNDGVHILDPFTGTGTFISRLLQSKIIQKEQIQKKFNTEIHANEIVLLAYYIASINIEAVYHDLTREEKYSSFNGIVLTDTFQLFEQEKDMIANLLPDNSKRRTNQKGKNIKIIIGNPPYSIGQSSANDNATNTNYKNLNNRIEETYAKYTKSNLKKALYDSYIRAFRWASDRIDDNGIIGFVTNGNWIDSNTTDGFRHSLTLEFSDIYIFHLRGNARTSGELRRKEKGNVFGKGTRTPICITILVKNKTAKHRGKIHFLDIGDYLDQKQKLEKIKQLKSVSKINQLKKFKIIIPNSSNEWINQGDKLFNKYLLLGTKEKNEHKIIFKNYSHGFNTSRDFWCFNFSSNKLKSNIQVLIANYNRGLTNKNDYLNAEKDPKLIKWSSGLESKFKQGIQLKFNEAFITKAIYRPFTETLVYFDPNLIERTGQIPKIFPQNEKIDNLIICVTGIGAQEFSCLMSKLPPSLDFLSKSQCFPLLFYENLEQKNHELSLLFPESENDQNGISNETLTIYRKHFDNQNISKKDIFFYIYGILHSNDYRSRFSNNLTKSLPRIPKVKTQEQFDLFSKSGSQLSHLHTNYNSLEKYQISIKQGDLRLLYIEDPKEFFRVKKMKFVSKNDKSSVVYNQNITIENIPLEAYEYTVNGKSALEWVMERQSVTKDNSSGIVNDANDYANETMNNPAYPLELFQKIITCSLESIKIINLLPKLDID